MRLGLFCLATDQMMPFARLAQAAEERGFDVLFTGEHDHIPVGAKVWSGGEIPEHYRHILDPFIALTSAAVATQRIRLGVAVCLVSLHDPIRLAKTVSTLDHLSDGRVVFGIGYGYVDEEIRNHGVEPRLRRRILRDKMLAIEEIWSKPVASYCAPYVVFDGCEQYPKPVQSPRPPVLLGAKLNERSIAHIVEFCDGWIPTTMMAGESLTSDIATLRQRAEDAGRDPSSIHVTAFLTATSGADRRADDWGAGPITAEVIHRYEQMGVTTLCLPLPSKDETTVIGTLDAYVAAASSRLLVPSSDAPCGGTEGWWRRGARV